MVRCACMLAGGNASSRGKALSLLILATYSVWCTPSFLLFRYILSLSQKNAILFLEILGQISEVKIMQLFLLYTPPHEFDWFASLGN